MISGCSHQSGIRGVAVPLFRILGQAMEDIAFLVDLEKASTNCSQYRDEWQLVPGLWYLTLVLRAMRLCKATNLILHATTVTTDLHLCNMIPEFSFSVTPRGPWMTSWLAQSVRGEKTGLPCQLPL